MMLSFDELDPDDESLACWDDASVDDEASSYRFDTMFSCFPCG